jgi:hypothetical protein
MANDVSVGKHKKERSKLLENEPNNAACNVGFDVLLLIRVG